MDFRSDRISLNDSLEAVNDWFYDQGWTDGLPIVPPTAERVEKILAWTDRDSQDELGAIPPKYGIATIEKMAINAVMAGCLPEYFPIVIAAVEALLEAQFNLYAVQSTTHPCAPLVIVNGPLAREVGLNARYNAFGQGWRPNATIGRALRLVLLNIGGGAPGILDRATQGQPGKYSYCVAENEDENPWEPLHVERGFPADVSTVTVCGAEGPHNINDHVSTAAPGILTTIASTMAGMGSNNAYAFGEPILALGPEHAEILARDGIRKEDIRDYVFRHARVPRAQWEAGGMFGMGIGPDNLFPGEAALPLIRTPAHLMIIVVGGPGRHSCWMPTFGAMTRSVTRAIALKEGTPIRSIQDVKRGT
ncbi:MAG: hypothetical protein AB7P18_23120 [Candidatus Binatia bacterium]